MEKRCELSVLRRCLGVLPLLGLLAAVQAPGALAQSYPVKTVRFVVPSSPGGSMDFSARMIARGISAVWKQQVIVENRPGANFMIGTDYVAKSRPDGYVLLFSTLGGTALNPAVFDNLPYKADDLIPVVQTSKNNVLLYVNNAVPAKTVAEFLALLRASPGKYNHASGGTSTFMLGHLFRSVGKVSFEDINFKGGSLAFASLAGGQTHFSFGDPNTAGAAVRAGKVRPLAAATKVRSPLLPNMPTMIESGVPNFYFTSGVGVFAPAGTPMDIVRKINADVQAVARSPELTKILERTGSEVETGSPEDFSRLVHSELDLWSRLVKERNIKVGG